MNAEQRRDQAWNRYATIPHADIDVGWAEYLAELEAIKRAPVDKLTKGERRRLLAELIERDGTECWLCGKETTPFDRTVEHLEAVSLGGTHDLDNLAVAHLGCNRAMGNAPLADKLAMRRS